MSRAREAGALDLRLHQLRDYAEDKHLTTDDRPYGGGAGMVLKPDPIFKATEHILGPALESTPRLLLCPQGEPFTQALAAELAECESLFFICGHYEGVDERVREHLVTREISIGDYVLTNGALAAAVVIDAVVRLLPGVLGDELSSTEESHAQGLLEYPHYTRPPEFRGWKVPDILLGGHHGHIAQWRRQQSLERTAKRRGIPSADTSHGALGKSHDCEG